MDGQDCNMQCESVQVSKEGARVVAAEPDSRSDGTVLEIREQMTRRFGESKVRWTWAENTRACVTGRWTRQCRCLSGQ